ncbi:MAG TPA: hypothetical protein VGG49_02735, partial [Steroidobacteraceae bacterium]
MTRRVPTMPAIKTELLDELLSGMSSPGDLLGDGGVFRRLKKALWNALWARSRRTNLAMRRV